MCPFIVKKPVLLFFQVLLEGCKGKAMSVRQGSPYFLNDEYDFDEDNDNDMDDDRERERDESDEGRLFISFFKCFLMIFFIQEYVKL